MRRLHVGRSGTAVAISPVADQRKVLALRRFFCDGALVGFGIVHYEKLSG
jgi:hypothetical protein